jgi:hypothetical protein
LDQVGGGSASPKVGHGRRKDQHAAIQELKQKQKTIPITERIKGMQDMKRLQAELITAQTQKQE